MRFSISPLPASSCCSHLEPAGRTAAFFLADVVEAAIAVGASRRANDLAR
jgi:hypothetical protein